MAIAQQIFSLRRERNVPLFINPLKPQLELPIQTMLFLTVYNEQFGFNKLWLRWLNVSLFSHALCALCIMSIVHACTTLYILRTVVS